MKAFHNDPKIKEKYLARIKAHHDADQILKGTYWKGGKGCAVGCTVHGSDHEQYEEDLGIPKTLAYLEDGIFEDLPNSLAMTWPHRFLDAIPVGANLSIVWPQFAVWLLIDPIDGVSRFNNHHSITEVADLYQSLIDELMHPKSAAAWDAARDAAWAAAWDAAWAAAWDAAVIRQSEKLLELLRDAK